MQDLRLSQIWIYPIKSLGGISVKAAVVEQRGLQYDRRWMLVDDNGIFLTQRKFHEMALLQVEIMEGGLKVSHKTKTIEPLFIPFHAKAYNHLKVQVWDDECDAYTISDAINSWFSMVLNKSCRLVYMPDDSLRKVDKRYAKGDDINSFSDGYPILILGEAALDYLNQQLETALPINRFRPNLVFTGGRPHEEDHWEEFQIGSAVFYGVKPCARCIMTTINQESGESGQEPLKTLATYRKVDNKILFGQNVIPKSLNSSISTEMPIKILKS